MILMIDDEIRRMRMSAYVDELKEGGNEVICIATVREALDVIRGREFRAAEIVVLDSMMHPRPLSDIRTGNGLLTAVALYYEIRELSPGKPIIILTNYDTGVVDSRLKGSSDPNLYVLAKPNTLPDDLLELVRRIQGGE